MLKMSDGKERFDHPFGIDIEEGGEVYEAKVENLPKGQKKPRNNN